MIATRQLLKGLQGHSHRYAPSRIHISDLNVLTQPRRTFENLGELAVDIGKKKLLNPPTVAKFDRRGCEAYLDLVNQLWGTHHQIGRMRWTVRAGKKVYYILLAGERRFRACRLLWQEGCAACHEKRLRMPKVGGCFKRHFGTDRLEIRACIGIPAVQALFLQLSENTHMPVPTHEEATAYALLFRLLRAAQDDFTLTHFARNVGRSPDTIRRAIRYYMLPETVKSAVEKRLVPYGKALEIARLHDVLKEHKKDEQEIDGWLLRAIAQPQRVESFREDIERRIAEIESGQQSFGELFMPVDYVQEQRRHVRQVVAGNQVKSVYAWLGYLSTLVSLSEQGVIGIGKPFSEGSPLRIFRAFVDRMNETLPGMVEHLREQEPAAIEGLLKLTGVVADELIKRDASAAN